MSNYIKIPMAYMDSLVDSGKNDKAIAFYKYCKLVFQDEHIEDIYSYSDLARMFKISKGTAYKWVVEFKKIVHEHLEIWRKNNKKLGNALETATETDKAQKQAAAGDRKNSKKNALETDILYKEIINNIVGFLNSKIGTRFKGENKATKKLTTRLLLEGYTEEDFRTVIALKVDEWKGTDFHKNLTPNTLFAFQNFEKYINQAMLSSANNTEEWGHYNG